MTLYQFDHLNEIEQEESIEDEGVFLANRNEGLLMFDLYQIGDFYVEFYYNINRNSSKIMLRSFVDIEELHPYLDTIDISYLF
ncbi:MAG: hypothetical protein ABIN89_17420 [Chitinophagaceae bacterium]